MLSSGCVGTAKTLAERDWQTGSGSAPEAGADHHRQTEREEGALGARTNHRLMARALESESAAGATWCSADTRQICGVCDGGRRMACRAVGGGSGGRRRRQGRRRLACSRWHSEQQSNAKQRNAAAAAASRQNDKTGGGAARSSDEIARRITRRSCW